MKIGQTTISWLSFIYPQLIDKLKFRLKIGPSKCKSIQGTQHNQIQAKCDLECLMLGTVWHSEIFQGLVIHSDFYL